MLVLQPTKHIKWHPHCHASTRFVGGLFIVLTGQLQYILRVVFIPEPICLNIYFERFQSKQTEICSCVNGDDSDRLFISRVGMGTELICNECLEFLHLICLCGYSIVWEGCTKAVEQKYYCFCFFNSETKVKQDSIHAHLSFCSIRGLFKLQLEEVIIKKSKLSNAANFYAFLTAAWQEYLARKDVQIVFTERLLQNY